MPAISTPYDHSHLTRWMFEQLHHLYVHCTVTTHQMSTRQDINRSCVSVVERGKTTCQFKENQLCLSSSMCKIFWKSYHAGTVSCNDVEKSRWK